MPHSMIILYFCLHCFYVSNSNSFVTWNFSSLILQSRSLDTPYFFRISMMISCRGNAFHITGPVCRQVIICLWFETPWRLCDATELARKRRLHVKKNWHFVCFILMTFIFIIRIAIALDQAKALIGFPVIWWMITVSLWERRIFHFNESGAGLYFGAFSVCPWRGGRS